MEERLSKALKGLTGFPQRQDGTMDQLRDLERVAVKLGMYDASDLLRGMLKRHDEQIAKIDEKKK